MADLERRRRLSLRIDPSDLVLEIVSIVIAIILATTVGQIVANYQAGVRSREALTQIRQEVAHDDAALQAVRSLHQRVYNAFTTTVRLTHGEQLEFDGFARTLTGAAPTGFHPFGGTTTAWDLARNSNVLQDLPYALRAALQTRYAELAQLQELNAALYARLLTTPTESHPNFFFTAFAISSNMGDLVSSETRLVRTDEMALRALSARGIQ